MSRFRTSIDRSNYSHQTAMVELAQLNTAAGCGNLAYVMKNATIVVNTVQPQMLLPLPKPQTLNPDSNQELEKKSTHPASLEQY